MSQGARGLLRLLFDVLSDRRKAKRRKARRAAQCRRDVQCAAQYLRHCAVPRLHLGAGPHRLPDWLNADIEPQREDIIRLDASAPFPFTDDTFALIFSEHLIEHLDRDAGDIMLRECHRVLRPGGRLRVATPDLTRVVGLHGTDDPEADAYVRAAVGRHFPALQFGHRAAVINQMFRAWGHRFLYDEETLTAALRAAGFHDISRRVAGDSPDDLLRDVERHGDVIGRTMNAYETMVLEATKPPRHG